MPADVRALVSRSIDAVKLKILVFGPQVSTPSPELRTAKLQKKRIEIRTKLQGLGHEVNYAEELTDPTLPGLSSNAFLQELLIMREFDLTVALVDSPGTSAEAGLIATRPELAAKAALFLDDAYATGLVAEACRLAKELGAHFSTYSYPGDLDLCNLYGQIEIRVAQVQAVKFLR